MRSIVAVPNKRNSTNIGIFTPGSTSARSASSTNNRFNAVDFPEPGRPSKSTCSGANFRNPANTSKRSTLGSCAPGSCSRRNSTPNSFPEPSNASSGA
ncbi:hypothetical protein [Anthocerotibacter panamensis]|uniref:hypothetical protein n=1 Tax=Anthocerotibacter panamensis TaxID=2857077 RepID=UPI001FDA7351|nr:hypothetical protein [Anthocerotibacter panamensis]